MTQKRKQGYILAAILVVIMIAGKRGWDEYSSIDRLNNTAKQKNDKLTEEVNEHMARQEKWVALAARTFDPSDAVNQFDALIKNLLQKNNLTNPLVAPAGQRQFGRTRLNRLTTSVTLHQAEFGRVVRFLRDLAESPVPIKVADMRLAPTERIGGGREVEAVIKLETLTFLPDSKGPRIKPIDRDKMADLGPTLETEYAWDDYKEVFQRNFFAVHEEAPPVRFAIKNEDRLPVKVEIEPLFRRELLPVESFVIGGLVQNLVSSMVRGDDFNVYVTYDDSHRMKIVKDFTVKGRFVDRTTEFPITIPTHSAPLPPDTVEVTIKNNDEAPIQVFQEFEIDGDLLRLAAVSVPPGGDLKLDKRKAKWLRVIAHYDGGGTFGPKTFAASKDLQHWAVTPKPIESVAEVPVVVDTSIAPADPDLKVTGLATYEGGQELYAHNAGTGERRVFALRDQIDGGDLVLVVTTLGGVVRFPGDQFYMYPINKPFTERVKLEAANLEELPSALLAYQQDRLIASGTN